MFNENAACAEYRGANPGGGNKRVPALVRAISQAVNNKPGSTPGGSGNGNGNGATVFATAADGRVVILPAARGRELPVAMVNPYGPIRDTGSPVAGINAPYGHLRDQRQYGFAGFEVVDFSGAKAFQPLAGWQEAIEEAARNAADATRPRVVGSRIETSPSPSPSRLEMILRTIQTTLPATISAVRKQPYYDPAASLSSQTVYGQQLPYSATAGAGSDIGAQAGGALGNIGDTFGRIVAEHPYLTLAAGAALVLLFIQPPRRR